MKCFTFTITYSNHKSIFVFWCLDVGVTPVLIPNTEVKPNSADGTRKGRVGRRQNREIDFLYTKNLVLYTYGTLVYKKKVYIWR